MTKPALDLADRCRELLAAWDSQQAAYIAGREARFEAMFDVLALSQGEDFLALDLACGPGSLSARLLQRFPRARVVAMDIDPLLLAIGRNALDGFGDRLRILDGDITEPEWRDLLNGERPNAVLSTTALHWLVPEQQVILYRQVAELLAKDGVFLNGDHQRFDDRHPVQRDWAEAHDQLTQETAKEAGAVLWDEWWDSTAKVEALASLREKREAIFVDRPPSRSTSIDFHLANLAQAGFAEVGTIWQLFDDYVVFGRK